jgi:hypothetical protein
MQACLQKIVLQNCFIIKGCLFKTIFEKESQNNYFIKVLCSYFKWINFSNPNSIFYVMQVKPFGSIKIFLENHVLFLKTIFITSLKHCVE